jgi:hypothetical protein
MYDAKRGYEGQQAFRNAFGVKALSSPSKMLDGTLHRLIEASIDVESEPASRPVYQELQDQAALFSRTPGPGGRTKPVGLFPGRRVLVAREEEAEFERLLAAWFYVSNRYEETEILSNPAIQEPCYSIIQTLFASHESRMADGLKRALGDMMDRIEDWRNSDGGSKAKRD